MLVKLDLAFFLLINMKSSSKKYKLILNQIEKIKVGIDGRGQKSSWFLEEATVKTSNNHKRTYIFEVGQWFGRYSRDRLVEREFAPTRIVKSSKSSLFNLFYLDFLKHIYMKYYYYYFH